MSVKLTERTNSFIQHVEGSLVRQCFRFLGFITSVVGLVSLIHGALGNSISSQFDGLVIGTIEVYRILRDIIISGIATGLAALINFSRSRFDLPAPLPWIEWRAYYGDVVILFSLSIAAVWRTFQDKQGIKFLIFQTMKSLKREGNDFPILPLLKGGIVLISLYLLHFLSIFIGAVIFLLVSYAENKLGL
ncbi:hypothetical protein [Hyphococcus lacteus]|uniref:Uncharacterized protein n=1 Tax=Hyphococcus lacteus TaxID=3143536 RepID=A0ABV3Z641_9PROT